MGDLDSISRFHKVGIFKNICGLFALITLTSLSGGFRPHLCPQVQELHLSSGLAFSPSLSSVMVVPSY